MTKKARKKMKKFNGKTKKILMVTASVLTYVFLALCLFVLAIAISSKKDADGAATVFGKQLRFIRSDSMAKSEYTDVSGYKIKDLPKKTLIVVETVPENEEKREKWFSELKVGDVLTFRYVFVSQETVTHRITSIEAKETGGYIIELKGDNAASENSAGTQRIDTSASESPNYVIGKVTGESKILGVLVYALKTPVGIVCIIILPSLIIIGWEVVKIIGVLQEGKRKKAKEESEKQQSEIEALKRQLEALQNAVTNAVAPQTEAKTEKTEKADGAETPAESGGEGQEKAEAETENIEKEERVTETQTDSVAEEGKTERAETPAEEPEKETQAEEKREAGKDEEKIQEQGEVK